MKKMNILKITLTLVLALAISGAFAQSSDVPGTAAQYDETVTITYMMEGTTVPLFAEPDGYFHPSYDPDVANSLNAAGFTWAWTEGTGTLGITQIDPTDNYVTVSAVVGDAGSYTVNVIESAPAAWGGCNDGTGIDLTVNVVAQPDATLTENGTGGPTYNLCEGDANLPTAVTANITDGWQNYRLVWTLEIKTLTSAGADNDYYATDKLTITCYRPCTSFCSGKYNCCS